MDEGNSQDLLQQIVQCTMVCGTMNIEFNPCPKCGSGNLFWGTGITEVVTCRVNGCGTRYPCRTPRPPLKDSLTIGHYQLALKMIRDTMAEQQKGGLIEPTMVELINQSAEIQLLLAKYGVSMTKKMAEKAARIAVELSKLDESTI